MLLLTGAADKVRVLIGTSVPVEVHASYMDNDGSTVTPGRRNTATSVDADVVTPPPAGFSRHVKTLSIRNADSLLDSEITVIHTDGATPVELQKVILRPGSKLSFVDGRGFRVYDQNGVIW